MVQAVLWGIGAGAAGVAEPWEAAAEGYGPAARRSWSCILGWRASDRLSPRLGDGAALAMAHR